MTQVTTNLGPAIARLLGSPDGSITFDLPEQAILKLAAIGLEELATDACCFIEDGREAFDILWEKLDKLSKA
jgi:hypothetical protein